MSLLQSSLSLACRRISVGHPVMMAAVPCFNWSSALNNSTKGPTVFGFGPSKPFGSYTMMLKLCTDGSRANWPPPMPADIKAFRNSIANHQDSASASYPMLIVRNCSLRDWIKSHCLWLSIRGLNWASSWIRARSAFAARSMASASFAFERLRNSVWIRLPHMEKMTSPTIPIATPASGAIESFKNRPYGGWTIARISSAIMQTMTREPHQMLPRSHDPDAPSNSVSVALFVPFGRYQAGTNRLRTCCVAFVVWSLIAALLLSAIYLWSNT
jgi:hypothetical protein